MIFLLNVDQVYFILVLLTIEANQLDEVKAAEKIDLNDFQT